MQMVSDCAVATMNRSEGVEPEYHHQISDILDLMPIGRARSQAVMALVAIEHLRCLEVNERTRIADSHGYADKNSGQSRARCHQIWDVVRRTRSSIHHDRTDRPLQVVMIAC